METLLTPLETSETGNGSTANVPFISFALPSEGDATPIFYVDLDRMIEGGHGFLVTAMTHMGKDYLVRGMLEQTHGRIGQIIFDSEGEYATLRDHFYDYLIAAAGTTGDIPFSVATTPTLCRWIMKTGVSAVLDIYDMGEEERRQFVAAFLTQLLNLPDDHYRPTFVVIPEVHRFAPEGGEKPPSLKAVSEIIARGAKRGLIPVYNTQNIAKTSKRAVEEIGNKLVGRLVLNLHIKRTAGNMGLSRAQPEADATVRERATQLLALRSQMAGLREENHILRQQLTTAKAELVAVRERADALAEVVRTVRPVAETLCRTVSPDSVAELLRSQSPAALRSPATENVANVTLLGTASLPVLISRRSHWNRRKTRRCKSPRPR